MPCQIGMKIAPITVLAVLFVMATLGALRRIVDGSAASSRRSSGSVSARQQTILFLTTRAHVICAGLKITEALTIPILPREETIFPVRFIPRQNPFALFPIMT